MTKRKRFKVRVWITAAPELESGEVAMIVTGPGIDGTIARERALANFLETALNHALRTFGPPE